MDRSVRSMLVVVVFVLAGVGSTACASQPDDFPPLVERKSSGKQDPDAGKSQPEETQDKGIQDTQADRIKDRDEEFAGDRPSTTVATARKVKVEERWQNVRGSIEKGEVRTFTSTRQSPRYQYNKSALAQTDVIAEKAQRSDAPVLCPWDAISIAESKIISRRDSYSIRATLTDGSAMTITGTCMAVDSVAARKFARQMSSRKDLMMKNERTLKTLDAPYFYAQTEYGQEIEFSKFGCAYTLTYYCVEEARETCPSADQLVELADDAILMNGPQ